MPIAILNQQIKTLKNNILALYSASKGDGLIINGVKIPATKKTDKILKQNIEQMKADLKRKEELLNEVREIMEK